MAAPKKARNYVADKLVDAEFVRRILHYEPRTGVFTRLVARPPHGKVGAIATITDNSKNGRKFISMHNRHFYACRVAWLYMTGEWPTHEIDHKNLDPSDDRWENLREATHSQNMKNIKQRTRSTQPYKGVRRYKLKWTARIVVDRKEIHLGVFDTAEQAHAAYCDAAKKLHGEFARFN